MTDLAINDILATPTRVTSPSALGHRGWAITGGIILLIGLALSIGRTVIQYQTPGPFDPLRQGMCDFHNGIYFPSLAVIRGQSPYGKDYAATYPVARQIPFFSPAILALHAPLAMLPIRVAEVLYCLISIGLILSIAILVASQMNAPTRWDHVFWIAAALVFSRGGHITLFDGYFTFELVLATLLAIHFADRKPWIAAMALAIVAAKPTYLLPLGFLLLARGNLKALVIGAALSIITAAVPLGWMAHHEGGGDMIAGLEVIRNDISGSQDLHRAQFDESPVYSWTRIDLLAVIAKWTGDSPREITHLGVMGLILVPVMWLLFQMRKRDLDDGLLGTSGALILTTTLVSLYHQSYDAILLIAPLAGVWVHRHAGDQRVVPGQPTPPRQPIASTHWSSMFPAARLLILFLMAVPLYNYLSTRMLLSRTLFSGSVVGKGPADPLEQVTALSKWFTSFNGLALALAMTLLMAYCLRLVTTHPVPPPPPKLGLTTDQIA